MCPAPTKKNLFKYMDAQPSPWLYPALGLTLYKPIGFFLIGFFLIGFFLPPLRTLTSAGRDKTSGWRAGLKLIVAEGCWGASWGGSAAHSQVGSTPGRTCPARSGPHPVCSVSSEGHRGCPCPRAPSRLCGRCLLWGGSRGVWLRPGLFLLLLKPWWDCCQPGLLLQEGESTPTTPWGFHPAS